MKNGQLDLGPIGWWESTWTPVPVFMPVSNGGESNQTIELRFRATTSITNAYVCVTFPTALRATESCQTKTITGSNDDSISVSGVILPSTTQGYGPIGIYTKLNSLGQYIDYNPFFATVFITSTITADTTLTVTADSTVVVGSSPGLTFGFKVNFDTWKYDTVVIKTPTIWGTPSSPTCQSVDISNTEPSKFKSYGNTNTLDCVADTTAKQVLVYGVANDIDASEDGGTANSVQFNLKIASYTAPNAVYSSWTWTVEIWRWGTRNILKRYTTTNVPTINAGGLTITSWSPYTSGFDQADITQNVPLFMVTQVTTTHPIPDNGTITVTYSNDQDSDYDCYMDHSDADCELSSGSDKSVVIEIDTDTSVAAGTFKFTTLDEFNTSSAQVTSAVSKTSNNEIIDQSTTGITLTYSSNTKLPSFALYFQETNTEPSDLDTGNTILTGTEIGFIGSIVTFTSAVTDADSFDDAIVTVKLRLPLSNTTTRQYTSFRLPTTNTLKAQYITGDDAAAVSDIGTNGSDAASAATSGNDLTFTIPAGDELDTEPALSFVFYTEESGPAIVDDDIALPLVESNSFSNLAVRYESWVIITSATANSAKYIATNQFDISAAHTSMTTLTAICGNIARIALDQPFDHTLDTSGRTLKLEVSFATATDDLGSGLDEDSVYPAHKTNASFNWKLGDSMLYSDDFSVFESTDVATIVTAIPLSATQTATQKIYYTVTDTDMGGEDFVLLKSTSAIADNSAATVVGAASPTTSATSDITVGGSAVTVDLDNAAGTTLAYNTSTGSDFVVQLPIGFKFDSTSSLTFSATGTDGATTTVTTSSLQNDDIYYAYPAIFSVDGPATDTNEPQFGVKSLYVQSENLDVIHGNGGLAASCYKFAQGGLVGVKGDLSGVTTSTTPCKIRSADNYAETVKFDFTLANAIPDGGWAEATFSSSMASASDITSCSSTLNGTAEYDSGSRKCTIDDITGASVAQYSVTFTNVLPTTSSGSALTLVATINTYTDEDDQLDGLATTPVSSCTPAAETILPGKSTINVNSSKLIPDNAGFVNADVYLSFTLQKGVPATTELKITSPTGAWNVSATDTWKYVTFNKEYSLVSVSSSELKLTLAEAVTGGTELEVYVEGGLTTSDSASTTGDFLIVTTYQAININQDLTTDTGYSRALTLTAKAAGSIAAGSPAITQQTKTALSAGTYQFNFSLGQALQRDADNQDEIWIKFPKMYSPFIGKSSIRYKNAESTTYYIDCDSEELGTDIECIVDHWYVRVINSNAVDASKTILLNVNMVNNPGEVSDTGKFMVFHMNANSARATKEFDALTTTALPDNITVKTITASNRKLFKTADYTFEFYVGDNLTANQMIEIMPPREYNTNLSRNGQAISCNLFTINHADTSTDLDEKEVSGVSSCSAANNFIILQIPSGGVTAGSTVRLIYKVSSLANPEWGLTRPSSSGGAWNFDAYDEDAFGTIYSRWTNQFMINVFDSNAREDTDRTYLDVNAAYLGFNKKTRAFKVNSYDPNLQNNQLVIIQGTQSTDIVLNLEDTEFMAAQKVTFTPSVNASTSDSGKISFSSPYDDFVFLYEELSIIFRVAVAIDLDKGIYYIDWGMSEEKQPNSTSEQYDPPPKTKIEVKSTSDAKVSFTIEDLPTVSKGETSRPIAINVTNAPHTEVTIDLAITDADHASKITFTPSSVAFKPDVNVKYFTIAVENNTTDTTFTGPFTTTFTIKGTDAAAYNSIASKNLAIGDSFTVPTEFAMTTCQAGNITQTTADLTGQANISGIVYWEVAGLGTDVASGDTIKTAVGDIFDLESNRTTASKSQEDAVPSDADINTDDPWKTFQFRIQKDGRKAKAYGAVSVVQAVSTQVGSVAGLNGSTSSNTTENNYRVSCYASYLNNGTTTYSTVLTTPFRTSAVASGAYFVITFSGAIPQTYRDQIRNAIADSLGVSPYRVVFVSSVQTRRLQDAITSEVMTFLVQQSVDDAISPSDIVNINSDSENKDKLDTELTTVLGATYSGSFVYTSGSQAAGTTPGWVSGGDPVQTAVTMNSVTASMQCNVNGEVCGVCEASGKTTAISSEQVRNSLSSDNIDSPGTCVTYATTDEKKSVQITGLTPATSYKCYYSCFNDVDVFSASIPYSEDNPIDSILVTTPADDDEDDDDFASYLQALLALLMVLAF